MVEFYKCELCGKALLHFDDIKVRVHERCLDEYKKRNFSMGGYNG